MELPFIYSCKKVDVDKIEKPKSEASFQNRNSDEKIILGQKLDNPYSVANMKKAFANLATAGNSIQGNSSIIRTTHLYVRFLPSTWQEYDLLKADTTLKLYDTPLDYEVEKSGGSYQDPEIPYGKPTWQYTAVSAGYVFPKSIHHEILEELYIPEKDSKIATLSTISGGNAVVSLINASMKVTGNLKDTIRSQARTEGFNPQGKIQVYDTRLGRLIPLLGVKVRARRWFTIEEVFTNFNGEFYIHRSFSNPVNYALFYETGAFDVRSGTLGQAWWDGPKTEGRWDLNITSGVQQFYAHVFRGANRYHYGNIEGLKRPNVWAKLKYAAYDKEGEAQGTNWGNLLAGGIVPDIMIWRYNSNGIEYASDEIFSTTVHETAHGSHIELMNAGEIQFGQVEVNIRESWAIAVEWYITQLEYRERGILNYSSPDYGVDASYPINRAFQFWNKTISSNYTPLFIDLVDDYNQSLFYATAPFDDLSGFTLPMLESNLMKHVYGLASLSRELKNNKPLGVTDAQLDLFIANF